jgi:LmbE family N-acetylglucosaminyl deacetylase
MKETDDVGLPSWTSVLAVVAHPDDESFGLGAVLSSFARAGAAVAVLCLTQGEASTVHGVPGDLARIRADELETAAGLLGAGCVRMLAYPDGALSTVELQDLAAQVVELAGAVAAEGIVAFDVDGVTGHPDHVRATAAALRAADSLGLRVLGWTLPAEVAETLVDENGPGFTGHESDDIDVVLTVDRSRQLEAIRQHRSQAVPGSVLWRRLELLADREHLRWLR